MPEQILKIEPEHELKFKGNCLFIVLRLESYNFQCIRVVIKY